MLNPRLYAKLQRLFGAVDIVNENVELNITRTKMPDGSVRLYKTESGEQYRANCPFCGDTRARLYVSYAWGLDKKVEYPSSKLIVCHNERCHESDDATDPKYRGNVFKYLTVELKKMDYFSERDKGLIHIAPTNAKAPVKQEKLPFPTSAWAQPLHELPKDHYAVTYLQEKRNFDVNMLSKKYGLVVANQYPVNANGKDYSFLAERVFIPTYVGGTIIGWQARFIDPLGLGADPKNKYFNCTGWQKSKCLYGIDDARKFQVGLLVEGVSDVWRVQGSAFSTYGKSISPAQEELIVNNWNAVGVMYDPDTDTDRLQSAKKAIRKLKMRIGSVFRVNLPDNRDPADCEYETVWDCIERDSAKAGVPIYRPEEDDG